MSFKVTFEFKTEEEAKLFEENAMHAFDYWRFQQGLLKNSRSVDKVNRDGRESASPRQEGSL